MKSSYQASRSTKRYVVLLTMCTYPEPGWQLTLNDIKGQNGMPSAGSTWEYFCRLFSFGSICFGDGFLVCLKPNHQVSSLTDSRKFHKYRIHFIYYSLIAKVGNTLVDSHGQQNSTKGYITVIEGYPRLPPVEQVRSLSARNFSQRYSIMLSFTFPPGKTLAT